MDFQALREPKKPIIAGRKPSDPISIQTKEADFLEKQNKKDIDKNIMVNNKYVR